MLTVWGVYGPEPSRQTHGFLESTRRLQGTLGMLVLLLQPGSTMIDRYVGPFLDPQFFVAY